MDTISPQCRSALMSRVRTTNTQPEMVVRRLLHRLGYRYVLHDKRLPGKPDLVFPSRGCVIQVNGCFWHGHTCPRALIPSSNSAFWTDKIDGNIARDKRQHRQLIQLGWRVATVWECETTRADLTVLERRLCRFLDWNRKM